MNNKRRNFMKTSLLLGAGVAGTSVTALAKEEKKTEESNDEKVMLKGLYYSNDKQGRWKGKAGSHAPVITVDGKKVTIETKHGMSEAHYIVKHTLLTTEGEVLGETVFSPKDKKAISIFELKEVPTHLIASSFCNLHDLWVSEYKA